MPCYKFFTARAFWYFFMLVQLAVFCCVIYMLDQGNLLAAEADAMHADDPTKEATENSASLMHQGASATAGFMASIGFTLAKLRADYLSNPEPAQDEISEIGPQPQDDTKESKSGASENQVPNEQIIEDAVPVSEIAPTTPYTLPDCAKWGGIFVLFICSFLGFVTVDGIGELCRYGTQMVYFGAATWLTGVFILQLHDAWKIKTNPLDDNSEDEAQGTTSCGQQMLQLLTGAAFRKRELKDLRTKRAKELQDYREKVENEYAVKSLANECPIYKKLRQEIEGFRGTQQEVGVEDDGTPAVQNQGIPEPSEQAVADASEPGAPSPRNPARPSQEASGEERERVRRRLLQQIPGLDL